MALHAIVQVGKVACLNIVPAQEALGEYSLAAKDAVSLLRGREDVADLLALNAYVDLIIPRGSNQLVKSVSARTPPVD